MCAAAAAGTPARLAATKHGPLGLAIMINFEDEADVIFDYELESKEPGAKV